MNPKLNKTIIVLHISVVIYFLFGIIFSIFPLLFDELRPETPETFLKIVWIITALLSFATGIFIEIVIRGLKKNKFWAWVAGIIICGLYIPSVFIILGIIGLKGLVNKEVRKDFLKK